MRESWGERRQQDREDQEELAMAEKSLQGCGWGTGLNSALKGKHWEERRVTDLALKQLCGDGWGPEERRKVWGSICFTWRWLCFLCRLFQKVPELEAPLDTSQASTSAAAHTVHWAFYFWIVNGIIYHCLYLLGSHMCLSFCVWEVANEWIWSLRQCSPLCSMYKFHGAGAQPCQPCCLWSQ